MSNLILITCLLAGFVVGFFDRTQTRKLHNILLMGTIVVLLFIMGAILGFAPDLPSRLVNYGLSALVVTILAITGSVLVTAILVKIFAGKERRQ